MGPGTDTNGRNNYKDWSRPDNNQDKWTKNLNNYWYSRQRGERSLPATRFQNEEVSARLSQLDQEATAARVQRGQESSRRSLPSNWRNEASGEDAPIQPNVVMHVTSRSTRTEETDSLDEDAISPRWNIYMLSVQRRVPRIHVKVGSTPEIDLIYTGATCSLMSRAVFENFKRKYPSGDIDVIWTERTRPKLSMTRTSRLKEKKSIQQWFRRDVWSIDKRELFFSYSIRWKFLQGIWLSQD